MTSRPDYVNLHGQRFTKEMARDFKRYYRAALKSKAETFQWQGKEVYVDYAKYVLQYAEHIMGPV